MADRRLLVLCYEYPPLGGGGAKVVQGLAERLAFSGYQVDVVTMCFRGLPRNETQGNIHIHRVPCFRLRQSMCYFPEMLPYMLFSIPIALNLIRKNDYLINHSHFILPDGVICLLLKYLTGLPYILTAHGSDVPGYNPDRFGFLHRVLGPIWRRVSGAAMRIVCPSKAIESLILQGNPRVRTIVIPNGIDVDKFDPNRPKMKKILVVTRMFARKGVQFLIEALEGLELGYEVNIVGDGPYLEELRHQAALRGVVVKFWGYLDNSGEELGRLYETSSIFIFPSEAENFPIVLLEAMVAGMAIITTSNTGCAEVVGDAAVLVEARNAQAVRSALVTLVSNENYRESLGRAARARVEEHFGWGTILSTTSDLYDLVAPPQLLRNVSGL